MSSLTLLHIAKAIHQTPPPNVNPNKPLSEVRFTQLEKALKEVYPEISLWSCVVLGYGLETLDKNKKPASQDALDSLQTEDAECSHSSTGIRLGDEILCEFGIVDEEEWGKACRQHLVEFIAKDNLRSAYMDKPQFDELANLSHVDAPTQAWITQVLAAVEANMISDATPPVPTSSSLPRL